MPCTSPRCSSRRRTTRKAQALLCCCCAAHFLTSPPTLYVESFSLVQKAAAAREDSVANSKGNPEEGRKCGVTTARRAAASSRRQSPFHAARRGGAPLDVSRKVWINDDFALRMSVGSAQHEDLESDAAVVDVSMPMSSDASSLKSSCATNCESDSSASSTFAQDPNIVLGHGNAAAVIQRRKFLHNLVSSTAVLATSTAITAEYHDSSSSQNALFTPREAAAFEKTFPMELTSVSPVDFDTNNNSNGQEQENSSNSLTKLQQERLTNKRSKVLATQKELSSDPLGLSTFSSNPQDGILLVTGVSLWTLALWFLSGSRSNPLVNPIANVMYNAEDTNQEWLRDRNDGYFSEYPPQLTFVLSMIFLFLGTIVDRSMYFLADGDADIPVQLGGVAVLGGAFWEVGRLATGEKSGTRQEVERDDLIEREFDEFASKRLIVGRSTSSVHRSEIVKAFRRFNPKYRVENEEYPLSDIEIERVIRKWNRERGSGSEMSSAGFFSGVAINTDADAFAPR